MQPTGAKKTPCKTCKGKGFLLLKIQGRKEQAPCPHCNGSKKEGLRTK